MHAVYLVENLEGKIYIGSSSNVQRRVESHNRPEGSDWTQGKGPWKLIHTEEFATKNEALRRKYLKSLKAGKRIKSILKI